MNSGSRRMLKNMMIILLAVLAFAGLSGAFLVIGNNITLFGERQQVTSVLSGNPAEGNAQLDIEDLPEYDNSESQYDVPVGVDITGGKYADGVYEGVADGYSKGLAVEVTISDGLIQSIDIMGNNETPGFFEYVFNEFSKLVIATQSTDIDAVSGATYTSNAYLAAIEDALRKAEVN